MNEKTYRDAHVAAERRVKAAKNRVPGKARKHGDTTVYAKPAALEAAVVDAGFRSRSAFADSLRRWTTHPAAKATVLNLWTGSPININTAEVIALALGKHLSDLFEASNGRQFK
jgi:hypothetical protein